MKRKGPVEVVSRHGTDNINIDGIVDLLWTRYLKHLKDKPKNDNKASGNLSPVQQGQVGCLH